MRALSADLPFSALRHLWLLFYLSDDERHVSRKLREYLSFSLKLRRRQSLYKVPLRPYVYWDEFEELAVLPLYFRAQPHLARGWCESWMEKWMACERLK